MRRTHLPTRVTGLDRRPPPPSSLVRATGWLAAVWCLGFAIANVILESSNRFEEGPYAEYSSGLAVMSWIVFALKIGGAAVALASIRPTSRLAPRLLSTLLWAAASLLSLYTLGSVIEALGMLTGLAGSREEITAPGVLYVLFFALGATAYGVLAASYARRVEAPWSTALIGLVGAPAALGILLVALPRLLVAVGIMPDY
jgi:hypothetical protein